MLISKRNYTVLTPAKVALIKAWLKQGANQTRLAKQFQVSRAAINRIANKRTWADI